MPSSWSNAELRLMVTGENDNTWGDQTNYNLQRLDDMVNAYIGVTLSGATKTLDFSNDPTSYTQENGRCKLMELIQQIMQQKVLRLQWPWLSKIRKYNGTRLYKI